MNTIGGRWTTTVYDGRAHLPSLLGLQSGATFASNGVDIDMPSLLGPGSVAWFADNSVVFRNVLGKGPTVPIGGHEALLPTLFGAQHIEFNATCSKREAALGVVTLVVTQQRQAAAHR
jgi:hypothetical protein